MLRDEKILLWASFGAVIVLVGIFHVSRIIADELSWRFTGRRELYESCLALLSSHNFPDPSKIFHTDFIDYLDRMKAPVYCCDEAVIRVAVKELDDWEFLTPHLTDRQRKRYLLALDEALLLWFSERWYKSETPGRA